jgi:hypothetical protein
MPGGFSDPVQGYLAFGAVKFAGYSLAAWRMNHSYPEPRANVGLVGLSRTIIGMVFGAGLGLVVVPLILLSDIGAPGFVISYLLLVPVRLLEWWILILIFYDRQMKMRSKDWGWAGLGTGWSFVLDIPALVGFFVTGGLWIC